MDDLTALLADWPVATATAAITDPTTTLGYAGDAAWVTRIASVSKLLVGFAALVVCALGLTIVLAGRLWRAALTALGRQP